MYVNGYQSLGTYTRSTGANPTIVSCNANVVKIYNTSSLVRFEKCKQIILLWKMF
jgi:hypothetical protein